MREDPACGTVRVGDAVFLEGTGRWWAGLAFRAVVADVRPSDDTIKVRYADGGYKRFSCAEFAALVKHSDDLPSVRDVDVAPLPLDMLDDADFSQQGSQEQRSRDMEEARVRQAISRADDASDPGEAEGARRALRALRRRWEVTDLERAALQEAVQRKDFLRAHEIQKRIDALEVAAPVRRGAEDSATALLGESLRHALGGGATGAAAMAVQVTTLMWLRTTLYYQYRHGSSTLEALRTLHAQGGVLRFYKGFPLALLQGPLCRFGDTAANTGVMAFLGSHDATRDLPLVAKTLASASVASSWKIMLMPIDTIKTMMQVEGTQGISKLRAKCSRHGLSVLYHGTLGLFGSAFIGHYCWYGTYNAADQVVPVPADLLPRLCRNAALGFTASAVSDTATNAVRVLKTYRQTSQSTVSYAEAVQTIVAKDGLLGLVSRGLGTRILNNGIQAALFTATWKYLQQRFEQPRR